MYIKGHSYFLTLILVVTIYSVCPAQSKFESNLTDAKLEMKQFILKTITKNEDFKKEIDPGKMEFDIAPYTKLLEVNKIDSPELAVLNSIGIENQQTNISHELIVWESHLYCIPLPKQTEGSSYNLPEFASYQRIENLPEIKMVQKAMTFSNNYFFLIILDREPFGDKPLAFLQDGRLRLIDRSLKVHNSLRDYIVTTYGSQDKFVELFNEDLLRKQISSKMSIEDCKKIFRNDYLMWERRYPQDTLSILKLFFGEIDSSASLLPTQDSLLKTMIYSGNAISKECQFCGANYLFGKDITNALNRVLTREQFAKYKQRRSLVAWLQGRSMSVLSYYYLSERKVVPSKLDDIMNSEIYAK